MGDFSVLKLARVVKGFSQYDVEAETGIRQSQLSLLERGFRVPSEQEKKALAALYKISEENLFPKPARDEASGSENQHL
jgi:transcriptional regulator with XRE-family HTH domain